MAEGLLDLQTGITSKEHVAKAQKQRWSAKTGTGTKRQPLAHRLPCMCRAFDPHPSIFGEIMYTPGRTENSSGFADPQFANLLATDDHCVCAKVVVRMSGITGNFQCSH
ncbi:MAG TPA: hypothetical protein VGC19_12710 [Rhodanobacter sp.]